MVGRPAESQFFIRTANGADIAADPTLTSAWTSLSERIPSKEHLASDIFPVACASGSVTGARASIRFLCLAVRRIPAKACQFRTCLLQKPRLNTLRGSCSLNLASTRSSRVIFKTWTRYWTYPANTRSRVLQTVLILLRRSFKVTSPKNPRGQYLPRRSLVISDINQLVKANRIRKVSSLSMN